jgi:hypothetical protein
VLACDAKNTCLFGFFGTFRAGLEHLRRGLRNAETVATLARGFVGGRGDRVVLWAIVTTLTQESRSMLGGTAARLESLEITRFGARSRESDLSPVVIVTLETR